MTALTPPLPPPRRDMIQRFAGATVTRALIDRRERFHLGAVYDADGRLVQASLRAPDKYRARDPELLAAALAGRTPARRLPRALYLGHAFTHFGHFLLETLPALCWVREVDEAMPLLFHPFDERGANVFTERGFGVESLTMLGIPAGRIVMATGDLSVDELLLPPRAYDIQRGPHYDFRDVYRSLRAAVLEAPGGRQPARIYLSRSRLKRRLRMRLVNEKAIERCVALRGFTVLHPERMSLSDQIRAVASADIVAGVDGSALHLSAFARPGTHVLVMETQRRPNVMRLNALMDVETVTVRATAPAGDQRARAIDPAALEAALDSLGCPPAAGLLRRLFDRLRR